MQDLEESGVPDGYTDYREEPYAPPVLTAQEQLLLEATMKLLSRKGKL